MCDQAYLTYWSRQSPACVGWKGAGASTCNRCNEEVQALSKRPKCELMQMLSNEREKQRERERERERERGERGTGCTRKERKKKEKGDTTDWICRTQMDELMILWCYQEQKIYYSCYRSQGFEPMKGQIQGPYLISVWHEQILLSNKENPFIDSVGIKTIKIDLLMQIKSKRICNMTLYSQNAEWVQQVKTGMVLQEKPLECEQHHSCIRTKMKRWR